MNIRSKGKAKTLFIYPGSDNPYISVKGIKGEPGCQQVDVGGRMPQIHRMSRKSLVNQQGQLVRRLLNSDKHLSPKYLKELQKPEPDEQNHPVISRRLRKKVYTHNERNEQLQQLREENKQLQSRVDSLELYFSKIGLVDPDAPQDTDNLSLKVLLQQQKISSLIYMIKQYRNGNRNQSSQLERRLAEFEPQLEKDLTDKLAEVNKELERVQRQLDRMRVMYEQCSHGDGSWMSWEKLLTEVSSTQQQNEQLLASNTSLRSELSIAYINQERLNAAEQRSQKLQQNLQRINTERIQLEVELGITRNELENFRRKAEQAEYELSEKKSLEAQLKDRNQVMHETAKQLARAQNENFAVKGKLEGLLKNFNQKIFQETSIIERLGRYFNDVTENRGKLVECVNGMQERLQKGDTVELSTYLLHLYDRSQEIYECIISEFRIELESLYSEAETSRKVSRNLRLELETVSGRYRQERSELLNPIEKLLKYLVNLREIQAGCQHCQTVRSYHQQMKIIVESMSGSIAANQ